MKMMKKFTTLVLTICLLTLCFSMLVFAADGKIMFTDPQTKTGETIEIKGVVQKASGTLGKIEISMKYDTDMLKFISGDGVTETESGKLSYKGDATNETGTRKEFKFSFTALKEGTTKIEITDSEVKSGAGTVLNYTRGSSTITIAKGEEVVPPTPTETDSDAKVEVKGTTYTISNEFSEEMVPAGYEPAELEYDLVKYNVVYSEEFGLYLAYLVNEEHAGSFFMYVEADATFAPYEEIKVSDSVKIALLDDTSEVVLPKEYKQTTVVLNNHEFPAWHIENAEGFCVLYAINNAGEKSLYQLDNIEGTYQRFIAPEVEEEPITDSFIGKLSGLLENHLDYVILGVGLGFLLFLLIIVILSVKLYNRNAELDEIYDEYGLDTAEKTEDDILINLDDDSDEEEYDDYEESIYEEEVLSEEDADVAVQLIQEGMKELQPEDSKEFTQEIKLDIVEPAEKKTIEETSLGKALEEVVAKEETNDEDDFEDILENFSVDFIDLDD